LLLFVFCFVLLVHDFILLILFYLQVRELVLVLMTMIVEHFSFIIIIGHVGRSSEQQVIHIGLFIDRSGLSGAAAVATSTDEESQGYNQEDTTDDRTDQGSALAGGQTRNVGFVVCSTVVVAIVVIVVSSQFGVDKDGVGGKVGGRALDDTSFSRHRFSLDASGGPRLRVFVEVAAFSTGGSLVVRRRRGFLLLLLLHEFLTDIFSELDEDFDGLGGVLDFSFLSVGLDEEVDDDGSALLLGGSTVGTEDVLLEFSG